MSSRERPDPPMEENGSKKMKHEKLKGVVVLMKKPVLEKPMAPVMDRIDELRGRKVSLQLISSTATEHHDKKLRAKLGNPAYLEDWFKTISPLVAGDSKYNVIFDWDEEIGVPGAFIMKNFHHTEFYLKTLTLEDVPGHGRVHFVCNSWVYPANPKDNTGDRVFFSNQAYLPNETPAALRYYREEELVNLRGSGTGKLEERDRVYDYDVYNDLSDLDNGPEHERPILGGSKEFPYPRRGRTGRPPASSDPKRESRLSLVESLKIYVPRDEQFGHLKMADSVAYGLKSIYQVLLNEAETLFDTTPTEFDTFQDVLKLHGDETKVSSGSWTEKIRDHIPFETIKELLRSDGEQSFRFPKPQVIKADETAWRTDEEFAREMLAGINPLVIRRLQEFPPASKLDRKLYGNQDSRMTEDQIKDSLDGLTIPEALENNRLFILDHHDSLMPYLRRINTTATKTYATRTLLFLQKDGTLKPLAIELSLPQSEADHLGASTVYTPAEDGAEGTIWQLAKAYVAVNDSGYHQLVCHWLHTHAAIEPFIIATNRHLSILHPIHKLLKPHFKDTMHINALGRQTLINSGGILERTLFPGKFAMEMSATLYKNWVFPEEALPADLVKRGMAVEDSSSPHGIRLLVEDYPYAVDGLEIWSAIKTWVEEYCNYYYKTDEMVQADNELQSWWKEIREVGHADKKDEPWWPKMQTRQELIHSCTIIIWVASALHAAVNFGQYPYGGYLPNRPATSRRFIPERGTDDYEELKLNPEKAFLKTVTPQLQSLLGISLIEILSRHPADEVFLGQRDTPEWTIDAEPLKAFERFGKKLSEIEEKIMSMNKDARWKNRHGPAKMPYTLLIPSSDIGLTGKGIPNSISI